MHCPHGGDIVADCGGISRSGEIQRFACLPEARQITATQGDKKITAVSDEQGNFVFSDMPDGAWALQVDMLGFTTAKQDITQGTGLPGPAFELKMLPLDQIQAVAAPAAPVTPAARHSCSGANDDCGSDRRTRAVTECLACRSQCRCREECTRR